MGDQLIGAGAGSRRFVAQLKRLVAGLGLVQSSQAHIRDVHSGNASCDAVGLQTCQASATPLCMHITASVILWRAHHARERQTSLLPS